MVRSEVRGCTVVPAGSVVELEVRDLTFIQTVETSGEHLISGRSALARVHLVHHEPSPEPLALNTTVTLSRSPAAGSSPLVATGPRCVPGADEAPALATTFNVLVPLDWFVAGTAIEAAVDIGGDVTVADVDLLRYPRADQPAPMVQEPPPFAITFVPIDFGGTVADTSIAASEYLTRTLNRFPLHDVDAAVRQSFYVEPTPELEFLPTYRHVLQLLATLRLAEAPERTYYGLMPSLPGIAGGGLGLLGQPAAVGSQFQGPNVGAGLVAHELGHTFGLLHAPCGMRGGIDPDYPYPDGTIGVWGRDPFTNEMYPPTAYDLMGGCPPWWISDYHYLKILEFRRDAALARLDAEPARTTRTLIVTGSIQDGHVEVAPLLSTAARAHPPTPGDWTFRLQDRDSVTLLEASFAPTLVAGGHDGSRMFAFSLPVAEDQLARAMRAHVLDDSGRVVSSRLRTAARSSADIVVEPATAGSTTLRWDGSTFMAALAVDAASGRVLAFGQGGSLALENQASPVELILSDGIGTIRQTVHTEW